MQDRNAKPLAAALLAAGVAAIDIENDDFHGRWSIPSSMCGWIPASMISIAARSVALNVDGCSHRATLSGIRRPCLDWLVSDQAQPTVCATRPEVRPIMICSNVRESRL